MNVAPRYLGRGSWLSRRDPRVLIIGAALFILTVFQVWDLRLLAVLAAVVYLYYRSARIPFASVRANWAYVLVFVTFIVVANLILTGGELRGFTEGDLHVYFRLPLIGTPVSAESTAYAISQLVRFLSMAAIGFPIAFAIAPGDIGPAFARMGLPYKFAYAIELTFRFLPSLGSDLRMTIDAQRARGYEWERIGRTPIGKLRRTVPLMVPMTMNAIVGAEDTIDAMDLRAFGTGPRTWIRELAFDRTDWLLLGGFIATLVVTTFLSFSGRTELWVPQSLVDLAP